jgi:serine/threonine protein kinase
VLHQIGVGALGPVFRTYEPSRDRLVAVKVFRLDITPEQAQALAEELSRATEARLFHPSIVEPLAAGVEGTVAYRAEEYVAAESLDVAMRHYAPATLEKALPFITQLAGAIDFARAAGVGHGALHPRDIFMTPEEARATGFGVVDALQRMGLRAPVRRPYSAPERIAGEAWGTPADVFSLAAIAFELLTGRRPAGTGDQIGSISAAGDSNRLHGVLARAMHEVPASRYQTALAFAAALESGSQARPTAAAPAASAASPAAAATVVPFKPAQQAEAPPASLSATPPEPEPDCEPEFNDIAAEREEDEAHWQLSIAEARAAEAEADEPPALFDDREAEAAADELFLDAAEMALAQEALGNDRSASSPTVDFVDEPEQDSLTPVPVVSAPLRRELARPEARIQDYDLLLTSQVEPEPGERDKPRTSFFAYAIVLLVGLLIGWGIAYAVITRDRSDSTETAPAQGAGAARPPATQGTTASAPAPKEFSEQAVAPAPAAARTPPPAATPPDVPADAPAGDTRGAGASRAPASPTTPAPRVGTLTVRSTPAGASVTLNGTWRGRTPITFDELAFGNYVVRLVAPGYVVVREEVRLSSNQASRTISQRLQREPTADARGTATPARTRTTTGSPAFTGSVYVDSRPRGAKVFIDGKQVGTTPLRMPELAIGEHVVRLELKDHHTWTSAVRITSGEEQRVTGSLEPIR